MEPAPAYLAGLAPTVKNVSPRNDGGVCPGSDLVLNGCECSLDRYCDCMNRNSDMFNVCTFLPK